MYPATEKLRARFLRKLVSAALEAALPDIVDPLPADQRRARGLAGLADALREIHFPRSRETCLRARARLVYQEFFLLQIALALKRRRVHRIGRRRRYRIDAETDQRVRSMFPFRLTSEQERVIREIRGDLLGAHPMNRLLQGDVGSGKTAVALYAMLIVAESGRQAAIMAPTEVLAEQHHRTLTDLLRGSAIRAEHLPGGLPRAERLRRLERIRAGRVGLVIGTHSLIQGDVRFRDLGLVVVDEQHKFGVPQRSSLREKGSWPDVMVMTATPIPRTLSMTVFGDLDVSTIRGLPPGRTPPVTRVAPPGREARALESIRGELGSGRQAYYICPLVEETADRDLAAAVQEHARLSREIFPEFRVGLIHGRMPSHEKERVMGEFRKHGIDLLVGTVVVEVGVDVPRATVIAISHAERFGLSQLHQLRGRVGRGDRQGCCWLLPGCRSGPGLERVRVLARSNDGFEIAEQDLRLRGPGEFFGTRQHGLPKLRIGDPLADIRVLERARDDAFQWVTRDPELSGAGSAYFRESLARRFPEALKWIGVG